MNRASKRHRKKLARKAALHRRGPPPRAGTPRAGRPATRVAPADALSDLTREGLQLHLAGRLQEAEAFYRRVLEVKPGHADANHLLGGLAHQTGRHEDAVDLISKAIAKAPKQPVYRNSLGNALHALGRLDEAAASYRKSIAIDPGYAEAHNNLANLAMAQGRLEEALAGYDKALAIHPDYAEAHYNLANALRETGRAEEAIAGYEKALEINPDYADAHGNLANVLKNLGRLDDAVARYRKALAVKPGAAEVHNNLGNALEESGRRDEAVASYRTAIRIHRDFAEAHNNLGNVLKSMGQADDAVACYRRALAIKPGYAEAHYNLGAAVKDLGRVEEAVSCYRAAIAVNPRFTDAHNNLGNALRDLGRLEDAVGCYRKALAIDPDYAEAHGNLGAALQLLGFSQEAFAHCRRAVSLKPDNDSFCSALVACLETASFAFADEALFEDLLRLLERPSVRPHSIARPVIDALRHHPEFSRVLALAGAGKTHAEIDFAEVAGRLSAIPLFLRIMEQSHINDLAVERLLTLVRRAMLEAALAGEGGDAALPFRAALALHCFTNEYVFCETGEERAAVEKLERRIAALAKREASVPPALLAALAAYRALHRYPWAAGLAAGTWPEEIRRVIVRQIDEPAEEQSARARIKHLTPIDDSVSRAVREQYEENPYPRWVKCDFASRPRSICAVLRGSPLHFDLGDCEPVESPQILVAGCGTGQHALLPAAQYENARVLAVDLSLSSLSYAARKTRELGFSNIEYAQGDITELGALDRKFDLIECSGVLHHLDDPMLGWRVLAGLLRPGGFMKIGLYSEAAREPVVKARALIAERGYTSSPGDIRRCREDIIAMAQDEASGMAKLLEFRDFYSLSECRDLIFHVQEHRFTLPRIEAALEALKLRFLGFELRDQGVVRDLKKACPQADATSSLSAWHAFERDHPDTFRGMYQFWCRSTASL